MHKIVLRTTVYWVAICFYTFSVDITALSVQCIHSRDVVVAVSRRAVLQVVNSAPATSRGRKIVSSDEEG